MIISTIASFVCLFLSILFVILGLQTGINRELTHYHILQALYYTISSVNLGAALIIIAIIESKKND